MNQQETQMARRRSRVPPPARLGWPSSSLTSSPADDASSHASTEETVSVSHEAMSKDVSSTRRVTFYHHHQQGEPAPAMWTDKHAPFKSADLAVAPKKVKEVAAWMQSATSKLLVLVGAPGIGKSTMVRVLANELGIVLQEWNEPTSSYDDLMQGPPLLDQQGPMASFELLLQQLAPGFSSLISSEPLSSSTSPASKRRKQANGSAESRQKSILLLDDLPNLHGPSAELKFRTAMQHFLQTAMNVPVILIFSGVVEGKHRPEDLERLVDKSILYSPAVSILQIHAPTSSRMRKVLEGIVKRERISFGVSSSSSVFYDELCTRSGGDVRFAIMTLQFEQAGLSRPSQKQRGKLKCRSNDNERICKGRDEKLSTFHALGKLLYAKRDIDSTLAVECGPSDDIRRPPLQFDPEQVVEHCDMELGGAIFFLQYHCPSFFEELPGLADTLDSFSDAAYLLDRPTAGRQYSGELIFPHAYAGSLAARAVATHNSHPAAGKFRQFHSPKIFEVLRKRDANKMRTREIMHRCHVSAGGFAVTGSFVSGTGNSGSSEGFVADCLPFIKRILPSLDSMPSLPTSMMCTGTTEALLSRDEQERFLLLEQQKQVLQKDDIGDFDSDDEVAIRPILQVLPTRKRPSASALSPSQQRENVPN